MQKFEKRICISLNISIWK